MTTGEVIALIKAFGSGGGGSSGGGVLVVTDTDGTLDKTWQEIHDAMLQGVVVISSTVDDSSFLTVCSAVVNDGVDYTVFGNDGYTADSPNGYPIGGGK